METTVLYRTVDGIHLGMNVFVPATDGPPPAGGRPAIVMLHGGAWLGGSKDALTVRHDVVTPLVSAGFVVFAPDYRLAPVYPFPDPVDDVRAALAWVATHRFTYGVDPSRIGLWGGSAGGNLAALVATVPRPGEPRIAAVASWSGIYDIPLLLIHPDQNFRYWVALYLSCPPGPCYTRAVAASPADHTGPGDPPMLLIASEVEGTGCRGPSGGLCQEPLYLGVPADQARRMTERLRHAGAPVTLVILPGHEHARDYADLAISRTVRFFERYLHWPGA